MGAPGDVAWKLDLGSRIQSSPTVGPDGTIYIGTDEGKLFAVEPKGNIKWSFRTAGSVPGSAIITEDNLVVFGSTDKILYALRPDGTMRWLATPGSGIVSTPAPGNDGNIFITTVFSRLACFNSGGRKEWEFEAEGNLVSSPCIGNEGVIYFGSQNETLYAVNPDGAGRWTFKSGDKIVSSPALDSQGRIYFGCLDSRLYSVTPQGDKFWEYLSGGPIRSSPVIGHDGNIFVGSDDGKLHAVTPDGYKKWTVPTGGWIRSSPVLGAEGEIYVGSYDQKIYCVDSNGKVAWTVPTQGNISSSPALTEEGILYTASWDNHLYAIETGSSLSKGAWPMFRGNAMHTGNRDLKKLKPVVRVTNLDSDQPMIEPATFRVLTTVENLDTPPERVELYLGAVKVGEYTEEPYLYVQQRGPFGTYMFSAMVYLKNGARLLSDATYVEVVPSPSKEMVRPMKARPFVPTTESPTTPPQQNPYNDLTPPRLTVTSHGVGERYPVELSEVEVKGTAVDDVEMGWVEFLVGDNKPQTVGVNTNWSFTIPLQPGPNILQLQAVDRAGNRTPVQSIQFDRVAFGELSLKITGQGGVSPDYGKRPLEMGRSYPITAFPAPGYAFVEWKGDIASASQTARFTMAENLQIEAVFRRLPPIDWGGTFAGLAQDPSLPGRTPSFLIVESDSKGRYKAEIHSPLGRTTFKGQFERFSASEQAFELGRNQRHFVSLDFNPEQAPNLISGAIRNDEGQLEILLERKTSTASIESFFEGNYTFTLADRVRASAPGGFGTIEVDRKGMIQVSGSLGMGLQIEQTSFLTSEDGLWTCYQANEQGILFGLARFGREPGSDVVGSLQFHPRSPGNQPSSYSLLGGRFVRPSRGQQAFATKQHVIALQGAGLPEVIVLPIGFDSRGRISLMTEAGRDWKLRLDTETGTFEGSFPYPLLGQATPFRGIILQGPAVGTGFFESDGKLGQVTIGSLVD